jgi:hypothetical protein
MCNNAQDVHSYLLCNHSMTGFYHVRGQYSSFFTNKLYPLCTGTLYVMTHVMIHGVAAGATVPFSPLALVPPSSAQT